MWFANRWNGPSRPPKAEVDDDDEGAVNNMLSPRFLLTAKLKFESPSDPYNMVEDDEKVVREIEHNCDNFVVQAARRHYK